MKAYAGKEVLLHSLSTGWRQVKSFITSSQLHTSQKEPKIINPQYVNQRIYFKFNMLFVNNKLNQTHILLVKQQIIGKPYLH